MQQCTLYKCMIDRRKYLVGAGLLAVLLLVSLAAAPSVAAQQPAPPFFDELACSDVVPDEVLLPTIEAYGPAICGFLVVPANHAEPTGDTIRLGVVWFRSTRPDVRPDPLVLAQGGPGGSTIDTYLQVLPQSRLFTQRNRDIILFDQRGTLYAEPDLICTESQQVTLELLDQDVPPDEAFALELAALQACRARLTAAGVNLSNFDSLENAADIAALYDALGLHPINLYGVSYGTLLALHTMRDYPDILRTAMLDAVAPTHINFVTRAPATVHQAMTSLFAACAADTACTASYPDLEAVFYAQIARLDETPVEITLIDQDNGVYYPALLDGEAFRAAIFQLHYNTDMIPFIPRFIDEARQNRFQALAQILSLLVFDRTFSDGMYFSVICAEDADYTLADVMVEGLPAELAAQELRNAEQFLAACKLWNVAPLPPTVDDPVRSPVPTLLFSGQFDPVTPPDYAAAAAERLSTSYSFVFPTGGHGAAFDGGCADQILADFLDNPGEKPVASCLNPQAQVDFATDEDVLALPGLLDFMLGIIYLQGAAVRLSGLTVLALVLLLSLWLLGPLVWLVRRLRPPRTERPPLPWLARLFPWLAALNGALLLLAIGGMVWLFFDLAAANDTLLLFGLPASAWPLLLLPLLSVLLLLAMLAACVVSWRQGFWSLPRRLYYHVLTLAALLALVPLYVWGAFTALL